MNGTAPATRAAILAILAALAGCAAQPTIAHPERFYLTAPATRAFDLVRALPGGSVVRGEVVLDVTQIDGHDAGDTYAMIGTVALTERGRIVDRRDAPWAPHADVRAAMDPANVAEVFSTRQLESGGTITRVDWNRLGELRLPIGFERELPPSPFRSALRREAMSDAAEVALVWHKTLSTLLGLVPFGTFTADDVVEAPDSLALTLRQDVPGGRPHEHRYRFARGRSLVAIEAALPDGETLRLTAR